MKKCEKCGKNYGDSQNFCGACGGSLVAIEPFPEEAVVVTGVGTSATAAAKKNGFLANNWTFLLAIIGYCASWVDGMFVFGTIMAGASAIAGWTKTNGEPLCKLLALRIVATVFGALAVIEAILFT